jgi:hypothetical protein
LASSGGPANHQCFILFSADSKESIAVRGEHHVTVCNILAAYLQPVGMGDKFRELIATGDD